jgi:hypothetical protein
LKLIWAACARSELVETEGSFERPLVGPEVGRLGVESLLRSVVGIHAMVGAKLGSVVKALAGAETSGTLAARILVGDSLDNIMGIVVGTADRVVLEKEISSNTGLIDG